MFLSLLSLTVVITVLGFLLAMEVDCLRHDGEPAGERVMWVVVMLLTGPLGAGVYFFTHVSNRAAPEGRPSGLAWIGAALNGGYHALLLIVLPVIWLFLTPRFVEHCKELNVSLPYLMQDLLGVSFWMRSYVGIAVSFMLGAAVLWSDVLLYYYLRQHGGRLWAYAYSAVLALLLAALAGLTVIAIWLTYIATFTAASAG